MKANILPCSVASILLAAFPPAGAQEAVTDPVGFVTLNLQTGNNYVGFSLLPAKVLQGAITISSEDRAKIFLNNITVAEDQFNPPVIGPNTPPTHVIEVQGDNTIQGLNVAILDTKATGSELTLAEPLHPSVPNGAVIKIWKLWTIGDAFGANNSAGLTSTNSPNSSDLISIPNGSGGFDQYYYSAGGFPGVGWRRVGNSPANANKAGVPIYFTDGFIILARSSKAITVTGSVKPGQTQVVLETGNNFLVNLCPVNAGGQNPSASGRTLGNSNLYNGTSNGLTGATSANNADQVLIWNGSGFDQYYYSTGGFPGVGWRRVGSSPANQNQASIPLPDGSFVVLRRGAPTMVALSQLSF